MKTDLLDPLDELGVTPIPDYAQPAVFHGDLALSGAKSAAKDQALGAMRDVHEAADTSHPSARKAHIHAALGVDFQRAQNRYVQSSAIIKVELRRLVDNGFRKMAAPKIQAGGRKTANRTALDGEREIIDSSAFGCCCCDRFRQTDPQVDNISRTNLHQAPAANDFPSGERQSRK